MPCASVSSRFGCVSRVWRYRAPQGRQTGRKGDLSRAARGVGVKEASGKEGASQSPGEAVEWREEVVSPSPRGGWLPERGLDPAASGTGKQDSCLVVMQNRHPGAKHEKHKLSLGGH